MHILYWLVIGVVAGGLAKVITPGSAMEPQGCLKTSLLGIAGSVLVGFLMDTFGGGTHGGTIRTIIGATIGAVVLILALRKFWR